MKKIYLLALMAITLTSLSLTSCSKDNDDPGDKKQEEEQLDESQWAANLIGTWTYDSGIHNVSHEEEIDGVKKSGILTEQDVQTFTLSSAAGTFSDKYTGTIKFTDGTTDDLSYSYNIAFTYEYIKGKYDITGQAYLKCKVTQSDYKSISVGDYYYISINSMTKNTVNAYNGREKWVDAHDFTRK